MRRVLIADGYNVIRRTKSLNRKTNLSLRSSREELIGMVTDYKLKKSGFDEILLVFDGRGDKTSICKSAKLSDVKLVYSSKNESADDTIRFLLKKMAQGKGRISVVSDDNYVTNSARAWGAEVITTREFVNMLKRTTPGRFSSRSLRTKGTPDEKYIDYETKRDITEELKRVWGVE